MNNRKLGFTLIEIMVVIVIVGVLMGAVTLSFPKTGDKLLKEHAERFGALISLAQDEAILQSREMALLVGDEGYTFYRNEGNSWVSYSEAPFSHRQFPDQIKSNMYLDGVDIDLKDRDNNKPQVVILSSGEMTPFVYKLTFQGESTVTIKVSATGIVEKELDLHE